MTPREVVVAFYERIWNRQEKAAIAQLIHLDFTFRGSLGPTMTGHAAFADYVDKVTGALGNYRRIIRDVVCEGDRAFARMQFEGIHRGGPSWACSHRTAGCLGRGGALYPQRWENYRSMGAGRRRWSAGGASAQCRALTNRPSNHILWL